MGWKHSEVYNAYRIFKAKLESQMFVRCGREIICPGEAWTTLPNDETASCFNPTNLLCIIS